jgi:hypothetical protein
LNTNPQAQKIEREDFLTGTLLLQDVFIAAMLLGEKRERVARARSIFIQNIFSRPTSDFVSRLHCRIFCSLF